MNFLAHAYLAGHRPELIVGGVIGDWIKGVLPGALPADLAHGVALHRAIDSHAETNAAFCRSRNRVSPTRRRYAGVLVDIFYDHLLARDWTKHTDIVLANYCQHVYSLINKRLDALPESARPIMQCMAKENWLESYAMLESIADVLRRMSYRIRRPNPLIGGETEFIAAQVGFEEDFEEWLHDVQRFVSAQNGET